MSLLRNFIVVICFFLVSSSYAEKIKVCADEGNWYPYIFLMHLGSDDGVQLEGIHIRTIKDALSSAGFEGQFSAMPWKRCLEKVKLGQVDAVATASFDLDRARYAYYPLNSTREVESDLRVGTVNYVLVTLSSDKFVFNGDWKTIPQPVYVPAGFSIIQDLRKAGLEVDDGAKQDMNNFIKLSTGGKGSVAVVRELAEHYLKKNPEKKNQFTIQSTVLKTKDYYLPISKGSRLTEKQRDKIWTEIKKNRDNDYSELFNDQSE